MNGRSVSSVLAPSICFIALAGGCGGDESEKGSSGQEPAKQKERGAVVRLNVVAEAGKITFDEKRLEVPAGPVTFELTNPTRLGHNVRVQTGKKCCFAPGSKDLGGTTTGVGKLKGTADLKPGKYFFLCSVGGHWQLGQRGTLVVQ